MAGAERSAHIHARDSLNGRIARLADRVEADQIATAEAVRSLSHGMLETGLSLEPNECSYLMKRLTECLGDVLRIAESRAADSPPPTRWSPRLRS
ncbi:hypothetical protein SVIO_091430 [Streptomyces violaceusniger]|uniref:Uncharacterized protein n=1 Tax=Streptomyces violaceusniger TaxID=68280 RepID=A0A4D4LH96_STRVO|nr:hypothetical protein SVIO_091430 [Streptomyces violaceusniger]